MEIDAPKIEPNETLEQYYARNTEFWISEAENEFPNEGKAIVKKMASELCAMFWKNFEKEKNSKSDSKSDAWKNYVLYLKEIVKIFYLQIKVLQKNFN